MINFEECRKRLKIDPQGKDLPDTSKETSVEGRASRQEIDKADVSASQSPCSYLLRNRSHRDLGPPTATVTSDTGNQLNQYITLINDKGLVLLFSFKVKH